jgi:hypothetical protein
MTTFPYRSRAEALHCDTDAATAMDESDRRARRADVNYCLGRLAEQKGPECAPFWRQGSWRCELHVADRAATLKVFDRDQCVYEEVTEVGDRAALRSEQLKNDFLRVSKGW